MSAKPTPDDQTRVSPWTTPAATPGSRRSRTNDRAFASSCAEISAAGLVVTAGSVLPIEASLPARGGAAAICKDAAVATVVALVTFADVREDPDTMSVSARHEAVLDN